MKKFLVLELDNEYGMLRNTKACDYFNYFKYKDNNKIQKVLKKSILPIAYIFWGDWKKKIKDYQYCILFDRGFNKLVTKYIRIKNPKCKIILWLWNPISERHQNFLKDINIDEIWTYDLNDSKKYGINYNTQFYNKDFVKSIKKDEKDKIYDVMFIGNNKGRSAIINEYRKEFDLMNLNTYIKVIDNYNENIKYTEYLEFIKKTKTLLEIVNNDVSGLTLRSLESLFFRKKLITNNIHIREYDFYNPNNIFILGEDNIKELPIFLKKNYIDNTPQIIEYYDFEEWLNRFQIGD